ncbi:hypothetical protein VDQ74_05520 [Xanthomonas campestris pv. campestris]|nr:hypothetical protein [Xanthomonas campestris pv. campestris]
MVFKKLIDSLASSSADKDIEHGLAVVQEWWLAYKAENPDQDEQDIVHFVAPFFAPMVARLGSDSRWGKKSQAAKIDLIFLILLADVDTEIGRAKLQAIREHLAAGK